MALEAKPNFNNDDALKLWDTAITEINKTQQLELNTNAELRNERLLFYLQKRRQETLLLKNPTENEFLIKQTGQSVDSILTILNKKEEE